jgi:HAD superfamily hydrolase (TIGR01450 family)
MEDPVWLIDLDGVVWLGNEPIPGGAEAVRLLRATGRRVAFFTNNSSPPHAGQVAKLAAFGMEPVAEDVLTSAQAAARLCEAGSAALVLGGEGIVEALEARGVLAERAGDSRTRQAAQGIAAVVVGLDRAFNYERLADAVRAVLSGARLIGTNEDPTLPAADGPLPGAGAMLAAVACASGVEPVVAGKPHLAAVELVKEVLGPVTTVVGDRPSTDGAFARRLGARFALVHSGSTPASHGVLDPVPDLEAADLRSLVAKVLDDRD